MEDQYFDRMRAEIVGHPTEDKDHVQALALLQKLESEVLDCECNSWIHPHPECWDKQIQAEEIKKHLNIVD